MQETMIKNLDILAENLNTLEEFFQTFPAREEVSILGYEYPEGYPENLIVLGNRNQETLRIFQKTAWWKRKSGAITAAERRFLQGNVEICKTAVASLEEGTAEDFVRIFQYVNLVLSQERMASTKELIKSLRPSEDLLSF